MAEAISPLVPESEAQGQGVRVLWAEGAGLSPWFAWEVGLPPWWAQAIKHSAKVDYSQALKCNRICPARFWTFSGTVTSECYSI